MITDNGVIINKERTLFVDDSNIEEIRADYPDGLHFVVGDTHGQYETLRALLEKIRFEPNKDNIYFVGDYNGGGDVKSLTAYLAEYFQADLAKPGFHLIRGNHERSGSLFPLYPLSNLPDIIVLRGKRLDFYITHAGMVNRGFEVISRDICGLAEGEAQAYKLTDSAAGYGAPLYQMTWSMKGFYSQSSHAHLWPAEEELIKKRACIVHGHTPFCMLKNGDYYTYGDRNLFWANQHIWFSEDLQSFDIDSNAKGRYNETDYYRGLSCICLEVVEEAAALSGEGLKSDALRAVRGLTFGTAHIRHGTGYKGRKLNRLLRARPQMKIIDTDENGNIILFEKGENKK